MRVRLGGSQQFQQEGSVKAEIGGGSKEETEDTEEVEAAIEKPVSTPKTIKKTEVTEFSKMKKENAELKLKIEKLGKAAGAAELNINKFSNSKPNEVLTSKAYNNLSVKEKFAYNLNK
jgi:hypothetical protein